ncbi:MAG: hypothetical protein J0M15_16875 [Deltaproteobacteria bacterium]|nr:hypothetical protein [Deltaproteobacteria bacterium]
MKYISILILFFLSAPHGLANSANVSEQRLYRRCYMQLVQAPIPLKDSVLAEIKVGQLKAVDACMNLLNEATLDNQGLIKKSSSAIGSVQQKVLRTFSEFHNTWFSANAMNQIQDYNEELNRGSTDVYDAHEQAYFLTRALFSNGHYSDILKGNERLKAVRVEDFVRIRAVIGRDFGTRTPSRTVLGENPLWNDNTILFQSIGAGHTGNAEARPAEDFVKAPLVAVGSLVGIQLQTDSFAVRNLSMEPLGANRPGDKEPNLEYSYNFFRNHGGGIIGLPSYFLMNYGHGRGLKSNGTTKLPRRWVKSMMETFMCATLPTLRESDIQNLVVTNSATPFRKSASCVQCHATMDQAANVARNLTTGSSAFFVIDSGNNQERIHSKIPILLAQYRQEKASVAEWIHVDDPEFHIKKSTGKFFTRLFNGELLDRNLNSIDDLGNVITQTQDFYSCAAKRYFEFLTGIQVPLYDKKDPRYAEMNRILTTDHIKNREFVESLGADLQRDQSLKNLIKRIIASDYYRREEF